MKGLNTNFSKAGWSRKWRRALSCQASTRPTKKTKGVMRPGRRHGNVLHSFEDRCVPAAAFKLSHRPWCCRCAPHGDAVETCWHPRCGGEPDFTCLRIFLA